MVNSDSGLVPLVNLDGNPFDALDIENDGIPFANGGATNIGVTYAGTLTVNTYTLELQV